MSMRNEQSDKMAEVSEAKNLMNLDYVRTGPDKFGTGRIFVWFHWFTRDWMNFDTESVHTEPNEF